MGRSGNDIDLGYIPGRDAKLLFPRTERDKHLYICGGTGTGKSKFLEYLVRQDIKNWHKSKCGLLLLDPHGSLYDSLIEWLAWNEDVLKVPVLPIDLRRDDWIVSYNLLRQRETADPSVLVDNIVDAMAHVWGQAGTNQTPLFARWAGNVLRTLYEKGFTLVDAEHLVDRVGRYTRHLMTTDLQDQGSRQDWQFAETLTAKDFETQIGSTVNRLQRFIRNKTLRCMFGQPNVSLDFGKALEEGWIILVSLTKEYAKASDETVSLFATLLLNDLWTAAQERGKREGVKPFYVYLDEFQRFVTPTIADNLDEARGFGLHLTMAHQFPEQLRDRGDTGKRLYNSIMENASSKVVFRLSHEENLKAMAHWLFMGVMDPDEIKHELHSTKVTEYREERREIISEGRTSGRNGARQRGKAGGMGGGATSQFYDEEETLHTSESWSKFKSESQSESESWSESTAHSRSESSVIIPVLGQELSHVQFRSIDEQLFRAMAVLFDKKERQAVARLVGMSAPVSIYTPTITKPPTTAKRILRYLDRCYEKWPFALRRATAEKLLKEHSENFVQGLVEQASDAPVSVKRQIR